MILELGSEIWEAKVRTSVHINDRTCRSKAGICRQYNKIYVFRLPSARLSLPTVVGPAVT